MRYRLMLLVLLVLLFEKGLAVAQGSCGNFEPGRMTENELKQELQGAVLRLQVVGSESSGTGYLIDLSNGYILTAAHVLEDASSAGTLINVQSPLIPPDAKIQARIVKSLAPTADLALLQLQDPKALSPYNVRPVDISLRFPNADMSLIAFGYPKLGDEPNDTLLDQPVSLLATANDGSIEVRQAIFGGNSGGPLLDSSGDSVGTCKQAVGVGAIVARYIPMGLAEPLLDYVPLSQRMLDLDSRVRANNVSQTELKNLMLKTTKNPTNLDLYKWGERIVDHKSDYTQAQQLLRCPIIPAFLQRGIDDVVIQLAGYAEPSDRATAFIRVATREAATGQLVAALEDAKHAVESYAEANNKPEQISAEVVLASIQLRSGDLAAAQAQLQTIQSNQNFLSAHRKAETMAIAAEIDQKTGHAAEAASEFAKAADFFAEAKDFSKAGDALIFAASSSMLTQGHNPKDAANYIAKAVDLYAKANDPQAQAEAYYKLAQVMVASGNQGGLKVALEQYLTVAPNGVHATELGKVLVGLGPSLTTTH